MSQLRRIMDMDRRSADVLTGDEKMAGLRDRGEYSLSGMSSTGINVTPMNAEQATAVFTCIRILSEIPALLPLNLYMTTASGKEKAINHPLYDLLHLSPNDEMSSYDWRVTAFADMARMGNHYSYKEWDRNGTITQLLPLNPMNTSVWRDMNTHQLWYVIELPPQLGNDFVRVPRERIFHTRMFQKGIIGRSPIRMHAETIGLSLATEKYGAAYFGNGSAPGVVLLTPKTLSDDAYKHIKESWNEMHQGLDNAHKAAILEEGTTIDKSGIPNDEAQFLETRTFQLNEIARIYRIPPHMIAELSRSTNNNIEHQSLEFVNYDLMPWLTNFEQAIATQLLTAKERKLYFPKFVVNALLRGDMLSRYQAYQVGRQGGWLCANDIRELEDMNDVENGDIILAPLNMVPLNQLNSGNSLRTLPTGVTEIREINPLEEYRNGIMVRSATLRSVRSRHQLIGACRGMFEDAATRLVKRETQDVLAIAKRCFKQRGYSQFADELNSFYRGDFPDAAKRIMMPVAMSYGDMVANDANDEISAQKDQNRLDGFLRSYVDGYASRHGTKSQNSISGLMQKCETNGDDPMDALGKSFEGWNENRPGQIARDESVRMNNATSYHTYKTNGVRSIRWFSYGGACDYCSPLDGKIIGIDDAFVRKDEAFQPDGVESPLTPGTDIHHGPLHDGCECMIGAA
jgi:phage portal protein, HK97 family